jgi:hypothetical protein
MAGRVILEGTPVPDRAQRGIEPRAQELLDYHRQTRSGTPPLWYRPLEHLFFDGVNLRQLDQMRPPLLIWESLSDARRGELLERLRGRAAATGHGEEAVPMDRTSPAVLRRVVESLRRWTDWRPDAWHHAFEASLRSYSLFVTVRAKLGPVEEYAVSLSILPPPGNPVRTTYGANAAFLWRPGTDQLP